MPIASPPEDPAPLTDEEQADLATMARFQRDEAAYAQLQGSKPQTLGMALNDSPAGLLSWIVEKFRTWSDCDGDPENCFTRDQLITNVMLYWVTQTFTSSARLYWETMHSGVLKEPPDYVSGSHRRRALSEGGDTALPAVVGGAALQRDALGGHAARWSLRRHGTTRVVRRRPADLLPNRALSRAQFGDRRAASDPSERVARRSERFVRLATNVGIVHAGAARRVELRAVGRIGVPLTSTCRTPVGSSAVSRSPPAGKSRTRRNGPVPTVCGSNTHTSAQYPSRR